MLDPSFAGFSYPPSEPYLVTREKIREFADAIGAPEAALRDPVAARALGHPDVIAPPTFPAVVTSSVTDVIREDAKLGLDFARVVHGDQRIVFTRPIFAGDRLVTTCTIEEITSRAGHEFLTFRMDVTDADAMPVVAIWTRFVVRGDHDAGTEAA